jgi:uncharacterized protein UPF0547
MEIANPSGIVVPSPTNRTGSILAGVAGAVLLVIAVFVPVAQQSGHFHYKLLDLHFLTHQFSSYFKYAIGGALEPLIVPALIVLVLFLPLSLEFRRGALLAFGAVAFLFYLGWILTSTLSFGFSFYATSLLGLVGGILVIVAGILNGREARVAPPLTLGSQPAQQAAVSAPAAVADTKTCPRCAEEVKAAAQVCRFCGHSFGEEV